MSHQFTDVVSALFVRKMLETEDLELWKMRWASAFLCGVSDKWWAEDYLFDLRPNEAPSSLYSNEMNLVRLHLGEVIFAMEGEGCTAIWDIAGAEEEEGVEICQVASYCSNESGWFPYKHVESYNFESDSLRSLSPLKNVLLPYQFTPSPRPSSPPQFDYRQLRDDPESDSDNWNGLNQLEDLPPINDFEMSPLSNYDTPLRNRADGSDDVEFVEIGARGDVLDEGTRECLDIVDQQLLISEEEAAINQMFPSQ